MQDVNNLLKQYTEMRKMMKSLSGGFMGKKMGKMKLPPGFPFDWMPGMPIAARIPWSDCAFDATPPAAGRLTSSP